MANRAPFDPETQTVLDEMRRRRPRRRRLQTVALTTAAVLVLVGLGTATVAALQAPASTPTTETEPAGSTSAAMPDSSNPPRPAQGPTTTHTWPPRPPTTTTTAGSDTTAPPTDAGPATTQSAPDAADGGPSNPVGVVVIDPGHQRRGNTGQEPIGPGSTTTKNKVTGGTAGVVTGVPESEVVLAIALRLRDALEAQGVKVVMTRTTQDVNISNIERTLIANEAHADLYIRVHCDGADNSSQKGIHVLYPAVTPGWTDDIAAPSKLAAQLAQTALVSHTGAVDRNIDARDDMTGFNWADVPAIIPELGFMTNPDEDRLLTSAAYQAKIVDALTESTLQFLSTR